jgi:hypothetical protein
MKLPRLDPRWYALPSVFAVMIAGAFTGSAIGSAPIPQRVGDTIPAAHSDRGVDAAERKTGEPRPDHYPLVTPAGTIPVAALAMHGRLRHTRTLWSDRPDYVPLAPDRAHPGRGDETDRFEPRQPDRHPRALVRRTREEPAVSVIGAAERLDRPRLRKLASAETGPGRGKPIASVNPPVASGASALEISGETSMAFDTEQAAAGKIATEVLATTAE